MPYHRFDWHEHIREVWGEYWSAQEAVRRLKTEFERTPDLLEKKFASGQTPSRCAQESGRAYIVRLFAAFEAALRSFDQAHYNDPNRATDAATMIDQIGGQRVRRIQTSVRDDAHAVRKVRNFWAHESDVNPGPMTIDEAKSRLHRALDDRQLSFVGVKNPGASQRPIDRLHLVA
jgi:hypothetical protein